MPQWKCRKDHLIFGLAITFFIVSSLFEKTIWALHPDGTMNILSYVLKLCRYIAYLLAITKILQESMYSGKVLLGLIFITAIISFSMFRSQNKILFLYMIFLMAAIGIGSKFLIRCSVISQICIWGLPIFCYLLGLVKDYCWEEESRIRHFLGFNWTTTAPILFFYIILSFAYLKKGRLSIGHYIIFTTISIYLYKMTRSRAIFALSIIALTFFLLYRIFFRGGAIIKNLSSFITLCPFIVFLLTLWAGMAYKQTNNIWSAANSFFNGRLSLAHEGYLNYGITLLGQPIDWVGNSLQALLHGHRGIYNYVDCSYLQILYEHGLVVLFLILAGYSILLKVSMETEEYYLTWILLFILVHAITEPLLVNLSINPFLFLCATKSKLWLKAKPYTKLKGLT